MDEKIYKCECGKLFNNPQSYNGHKSHCEKHQLIKYGSLDKLKDRKILYSNQLAINNLVSHNNSKLIQETNLFDWLAKQPRCECCGKIMKEKYGSGRFCSTACAHVRAFSEATKNKLSNSIKLQSKALSLLRQTKHDNFVKAYDLNPNYCTICGKVLPFEKRFAKTCSKICLKRALHNAGVKSANNQQKRSKNEIAFYELCINYFSNVKHNEPIFNGWDASIIIEDYKLAVLWNEPWHYKQIKQNQLLEQIQTRDKIKLKEIKNCGYIPYIVKDFGRYNQDFVNAQFLELLNYISKLE